MHIINELNFKGFIKMKNLLLCACLVILTACGKPNTIKLKEADYKEWPLTVSEGVLSCEKPLRVVFTTPSGEKYGLNGPAIIKYPNIHEISKDVIWDHGHNTKMSSPEFIKIGLELCDK